MIVTNPFKPRGTVPFSSPVYITRTEERSIFDKINKKEWVTIVGSRQTGKTTLMHRIQGHYQSERGFATSLLDLSTFNNSELSTVEWLEEFSNSLVQSLHPYFKEDISISTPKSTSELKMFFGEIKENLDNPNLLLFFDEASAVPDNIRDVLYNNIRYIYTAQNGTSPASRKLKNIRFVFAGVFDPLKLIQDSENSPFNISYISYLTDFSLEQVRLLLENLKMMDPHIDVENIASLTYEFTNGHPHLTQQLGYWLAEVMRETPSQSNYELVKKLAFNLLSTSNVTHVVRRSIESEPEELELLKDVLSGKIISFTRGSSLVARFELIGAISESSDEKCQIRNKIYRLGLEQVLAIESPMQRLPKSVQKTKLQNILEKKFNRGELEMFVFKLKEDVSGFEKLKYEDLPGDIHKLKCKALIAYSERHNCYPTLVENCFNERPNAEW